MLTDQSVSETEHDHAFARFEENGLFSFLVKYSGVQIAFTVAFPTSLLYPLDLIYLTLSDNMGVSNLSHFRGQFCR